MLSQGRVPAHGSRALDTASTHTLGMWPWELLLGSCIFIVSHAPCLQPILH